MTTTTAKTKKAPRAPKTTEQKLRDQVIQLTKDNDRLRQSGRENFNELARLTTYANSLDEALKETLASGEYDARRSRKITGLIPRIIPLLRYAQEAPNVSTEMYDTIDELVSALKDL